MLPAQLSNNQICTISNKVLFTVIHCYAIICYCYLENKLLFSWRGLANNHNFYFYLYHLQEWKQCLVSPQPPMFVLSRKAGQPAHPSKWRNLIIRLKIFGQGYPCFDAFLKTIKICSKYGYVQFVSCFNRWMLKWKQHLNIHLAKQLR